MPAIKEKKERIVARVPATVRKTIKMAADLQGAAMNQFMVQAAYKEAQEILERETFIRLTSAQAKQVFELIEKPPKPNAALLAAAKRFKANVRA
jgi:uncharacterized protein (DUF1778 family)